MSRRGIRLVGAAAATVMAGIYYLIGLGVLQVVDPGTTTGEAPDMLVFGAGAGTLFLVGAILLATMDRRLLWVVGAVLQVFVATMYVVVSQQRAPAFELWGITLRVLQVPLFAALVYLALRSPEAPRVRA